MAKLLRLPAVVDRTGLSRATIYLMISRGEFPRQKQIGPRAVGWLESDIESWINKIAGENSVLEHSDVA